MNILIVDDDEDIRFFLGSSLAEEGHRDIITAASANEALRILGLADQSTEGRHCENYEPDLILMDIIMTGTDGVEACRIIKENERFEDIPVIMVTSLKETGVLEKAFAAGAHDYVTKPINRVELIARVRSALRLKKEMDKRKAREVELGKALSDVKVLSGLIPICSHCKKMRNDEGYWQHLEKYIGERSNARFSHGICDECVEKYYPEIADQK